MNALSLYKRGSDSETSLSGSDTSSLGSANCQSSDDNNERQVRKGKKIKQKFIDEMDTSYRRLELSKP
jgi:hypothetical protein